jgi:phosphatidylglycerol---prolipoprotein diacylglyceryl transferase
VTPAVYPVIHIGPVALRSYTLCFVVGVGFALVIACHKARLEGLNPVRFLELALCSICVGILGARALDVAVHFDYYREHPGESFQMGKGMAFIGGPVLVIPFVLLFTRWVRLPLWKTFDLMALGLTPALGITRLGCFFSGCCHGVPTNCPLGIPLSSELVEPSCRGVPLHPTQLYEAAGLLLLFPLLWRLWPRRSFDGQVVLLFFLVYAVLRGIIETVRGDSVRGFVLDGWLTTSQFVLLLLFAGALPIYVIRRRQALADVTEECS